MAMTKGQRRQYKKHLIDRRKAIAAERKAVREKASLPAEMRKLACSLDLATGS